MPTVLDVYITGRDQLYPGQSDTHSLNHTFISTIYLHVYIGILIHTQQTPSSSQALLMALPLPVYIVVSALSLEARHRQTLIHSDYSILLDLVNQYHSTPVIHMPLQLSIRQRDIPIII